MDLSEAQFTGEIMERGGRAALLRELFAAAPVVLTAEQYTRARLAAAARCTAEDLDLKLHPRDRAEEATSPRGPGYLDRVRRRPAALSAKTTAQLMRQSWTPFLRNLPPGAEAWQYVWDARLALGLIDPATAATGSRGLEIHLFPMWHVMGDWTARALREENTFAVPTAPPTDGR